jgi:hypothetical protein
MIQDDAYLALSVNNFKNFIFRRCLKEEEEEEEF